MKQTTQVQTQAEVQLIRRKRGPKAPPLDPAIQRKIIEAVVNEPLVTVAAIAERFGMKPSRVNQIIRAENARRVREAMGQQNGGNED